MRKRPPLLIEKLKFFVSGRSWRFRCDWCRCITCQLCRRFICVDDTVLLVPDDNTISHPLQDNVQLIARLLHLLIQPRVIESDTCPSTDLLCQRQVMLVIFSARFGRDKCDDPGGFAARNQWYEHD